ncbi:MAG: DUF4422 domain-containing protein [Lachnospirales bacterium]
MVTSLTENKSRLYGKEVKELIEFVKGKNQSDKSNIKILICTPINIMGEIKMNLDEVGLYNYTEIDSKRWAKLQEMAYLKSKEFNPLVKYPIGVNMPNLRIFKSIHHKDRELKYPMEDAEYISKLQVGAVNTYEILTELRDDKGDNLSKRNGNYSELTGLYWLWKNIVNCDADCKNKYYGLVQYRRVFNLLESDLLRFVDNQIDVVLPYPLSYVPNIEEHHKRYLTDIEWNAVLQALECLEPKYVDEYKKILMQEYFYNYNIIIAKGNVLNDYCSWLFPLLIKIEQIIDNDGKKIPNRYIGYIGETLETLYFMHNKENLRVAVTESKLLS